jgi:hypothetical protein
MTSWSRCTGLVFPRVGSSKITAGRSCGVRVCVCVCVCVSAKACESYYGTLRQCRPWKDSFRVDCTAQARESAGCLVVTRGSVAAMQWG